MGEQQTCEQFWEEAVTRLLHPTQLLILEALARLKFPLSATALERISDGQIALVNWAYHLRSLERLGLLELVDEKPRRGAQERFFYLSLNRKPFHGES